MLAKTIARNRETSIMSGSHRRFGETASRSCNTADVRHARRKAVARRKTIMSEKLMYSRQPPPAITRIYETIVRRAQVGVRVSRSPRERRVTNFNRCHPSTYRHSVTVYAKTKTRCCTISFYFAALPFSS